MCSVLVQVRTGCNIACSPGNCLPAPWGGWSACSRSCGGGSQFRKRAETKGKPTLVLHCAALRQTRNCNPAPCPRDCAVTSFTAWDACDRSCGGGLQRRHRAVQQRQIGGKACPALQHERVCNIMPCPRSCSVGAFSSWSSCSRSCGTGHKMRHRNVLVAPMYGGLTCPVLTQAATCREGRCPGDCAVGQFTMWSSCSRSCGSGSSSRVRNVVAQASFGGKACPTTRQVRTCGAHKCPRDCAMSPWQIVVPCSTTCGFGRRTRARSTLHGAEYGGATCPARREVRACYTGPCPVHCRVTRWWDWNACSVTCGGGWQRRERTVIETARFGGYTCPQLEETRQCGQSRCARDCTLSTFDHWSRCSASCGTGTQFRVSYVLRAGRFGGRLCAHLSEERNCGTQPCPVDCRLTKFGRWTDCSNACGQGVRYRFRSIREGSAHGGQKCAKMLQQSAPCTSHSGCVAGEM